MKKTLVLTGFMGSGKSTVGRVLSGRLKIPFLDLDHVIERGEKVTIPEIFEKNGETYFRELEHRYLSQIIEGPPVVLSLGGGALQLGSNIGLIRQNSILIYLKVPAEVLTERLKNDMNRPLLRGIGGQEQSESDLRHRIESLLREREKSYNLADVTVQVQPKWNIINTTDEVLRQLSKYASTTHSEYN